MRLFKLFTAGLLLINTLNLNAQQKQPFIFTLYGGLFFPSYSQFKVYYQSSSDLIWGIGISLPIKYPLYAIGDISFFKANAIVNSNIDSVHKFQERFIHLGALDKQPIIKNLSIRLSIGFSYTTIEQIYSSNRSPARSISADKKLGYFGGIGLEQMIDNEGHFSIFGDIIYDYRRSLNKELSGDFGGVRIVLGVHMFLFE